MVWVRTFNGRRSLDAQSFSVRPDLWGPGLFVRSGDDRPGQVYATWGPPDHVTWLARLACEAGRATPGVAEANILSGDIRVTRHPDQGATWARLEGS